MRIRYASLLLPWLATLAKAQDGSPTFVLPSTGLFVDLRADEVPALAAHLPKTALARLLAEPDVASAWQLAAERLRGLREKRQRIAAFAKKLPEQNQGLQLPGATDASELAMETLLRVDWSDVRSFRFVGLMQEGRRTPIGSGILRCPPKAEGRLTRLFEETAKTLAADPTLKVVHDAKFEGFPAHVFEVAETGENNRFPGYEPLGVWMLHLPGTFAFGEGIPADCGSVGAAPAAPAGIGLTMNLQAYMRLITGGVGGLPQEMTALGLDQLQTFDWRGRFVGEHVLEEFELAFADTPVGLAPALWSGSAPLPKQALPDGALLQVRVAVDLAKLLPLLAESGAPLPPPIAEALQKSLTGGIAFGVSAPAKGGVVPRLCATLGVADAAALQDALKQFLPPDVKTKQGQLEGVDCTSLLLDDLPPALRPTWCVVDGQLHVAESPNSLRDHLRAQKTGAEAMTVGDAPIAAGPGEPMPSVDVRADLAAAYAAFHGIWLPLYELAEAASPMASKALLPRKDLPEPEAVGKHLRSVRGVMRQTAKGYVLQFQGPLGGPLAASFAATYGPMMSASMHRDFRTEQMELAIAQHLASEVWPKFEAFQKANGRWPKDLAELFVDQKLAADALLVPGDDAAELVAMPAGDARTVRSSFQYHPDTPTRVLDGNDEKVLLSSVRVLGWQRVSLTTKGETKATYGFLNDLQVEVVEPAPPPPAEEAK